LTGVKFDLADLALESAERPGWDTTWGAVFAQVASVCLENNGHGLEAKLTVEGICSEVFILMRQELSKSAINFNKDDKRSAEFGAYGVSALLVPKLLKMTIIEAARIGTGFDFWLGPVNPVDSNTSYFQNKARLEVSGIMTGDKSTIKKRVKAKLRQITPTDNTPYPGFVSIVEFGSLTMFLLKKQVGDEQRI
jgi:hypothetical protein